MVGDSSSSSGLNSGLLFVLLKTTNHRAFPFSKSDFSNLGAVGPQYGVSFLA